MGIPKSKCLQLSTCPTDHVPWLRRLGTSLQLIRLLSLPGLVMFSHLLSHAGIITILVGRAQLEMSRWAVAWFHRQGLFT